MCPEVAPLLRREHEILHPLKYSPLSRTTRVRSQERDEVRDEGVQHCVSLVDLYT